MGFVPPKKIFLGTPANNNVNGSRSEAINQCSACHSISVFTFYLFYRRKCILKHIYFQTYFHCEIFQFGKSIFTY